MKVSVLMLAYNHEKYIRKAIESVINQITDFGIELVIGEDFSLDGTREIVAEYAQRFPDKVNALLHPHSLGLAGKNNFVTTFKSCKGKFIAFLDGDDYWTDPYKLQKQVDFLEAHPDYVICFHNLEVAYEDGSKAVHPTNLYQKDTYTLEDLCLGNFIYTASCMFRNPGWQEFPDWFYEAMPGDWPIYFIIARHGKIRYLDEIMGVYRVHSGGVWSLQRRSKSLDSIIRTAKHLRAYVDLAEHQVAILNGTIAGWLFELYGLLMREGRHSEAAAAAEEYFTLGDVKVSVVIPVTNQGLPLAKRLETVIRQTCPIFEILLLADTAAGKNAQLLGEYAARHARIRVLEARPAPANLCKQWDRGVDATRGNYVWIADSNDFAHEELLTQLLAPLLTDAKMGLSYCQSWRVDARDAITGSCTEAQTAFGDSRHWEADYINKGPAEVVNYLIYRNTIPAIGAVLFKRSVYLEAGMAQATGQPGGDWYLWLRMLLISNVAYVASHLNYCRQEPPQTGAPAIPLAAEVALRKRLQQHLVRSVSRSTPLFLQVYELNKMLRLASREELGYWYIKQGNFFRGFGKLLPAAFYPKLSLHALKVGAYHLKKRLRSTRASA